MVMSGNVTSVLIIETKSSALKSRPATANPSDHTSYIVRSAPMHRRGEMACCWAKVLTFSFVLGVAFGQREIFFPWVGPVVVPLDGLIVAPPDIAKIVIANDEGIKREIRVREEIDVIIDCGLVVDTFLTNNALSESQITVTWYVRKLRTNRRLRDNEIVVSEMLNPDPSQQSFQFNGSVNQILIIGRTSLPNFAREGNAGEYRCEACETNMSSNCQSGNLSVSVIAYKPVLVSSNTNYSIDSYYIGTDICILPNNPPELVLTCTHNTSLPTTLAPKMVATWTVDGGTRNILATFLEDNSIVRNANLIIETFLPAHFASLLGTYTCVLENSAGNDTATTTITKCCEDSDIPVIAASSGFVAMPLNGVLIIGQSTCLGDEVLTIMCPLSSGPQFCDITYTWSKDGQVIENESNFSIAVSEHGQYFCHVSSKCGIDGENTTIYTLPDITSFTGSISGVADNGCSRRGSPSTPSDLCPKPNEQFTLSCDSIDSYNISGPLSTVSDGPLVIESASESSAGVYTCSSTNPCNSASVSFTVTLGEEIGEWEVGIWSECSVKCNQGVRTRLVSCIGTISRQLLPENLCGETKPASSETCIGRGPCFLNPTWVHEPWSNCSKYCGMGKQTRRVYCQIPTTQQIVDNSQCGTTQSQPLTTRYCNASPCCQYDLLPTQCNFIAGTDMCSEPLYQEMCCCTCRKTGSGSYGMGLSQQS